MPSNIEIKATVADMAALRERVLTVSSSAPEVLHQEDVFLRAPKGRLKLRIFGPEQGELIAYERADTRAPKPSAYQISRTREPHTLRALLAAALGEIGVVVKRRELHLVGQTRVHLDEVEHLGTFMELEVVLREDQSPEDGTRVARSLMQTLCIAQEDLVAGAYFDLLASR